MNFQGKDLYYFGYFLRNGMPLFTRSSYIFDSTKQIANYWYLLDSLMFYAEPMSNVEICVAPEN